MALLPKAKALKAAVIAAIAASADALLKLKADYQAREAARDARIAELEAQLAALGAEVSDSEIVVDEIAFVVNPTVAADEIVKAANAADVPNTAAVDAAIAETVDTVEPTTAVALDEAVEMLVIDATAV